MEALVLQATDEKQTRENWALMIRICEECVKSKDKTRTAVAAVARRLDHRNANVVLYSLTLCNSLVQTRIGHVHVEVSSRVLVDAIVRLLSTSSVHAVVKARVSDLLLSWRENFAASTNLPYLFDAIDTLKSKGLISQFSGTNQSETSKTAAQRAKDQENEELQLALALSLSDASVSSNNNRPISSSVGAPVPICRARALYDFPGLEEGELRLAANDLIDVFDDSTYQEWWKGQVGNLVGIFPSNYVERIALSVAASSNGVLSSNPAANSSTSTTRRDVENVEQFVGILANANPRENLAENLKIQELHNAILMIRPKLLTELEERKAKQDELISLNERFTAACSTYHRLMDQSMAVQRAAYQSSYANIGNGYGQAALAPAKFQQQSYYVQQPQPQPYQQFPQQPLQQQQGYYQQ
ncbi:ESCRT-0 subunit protein hse1 [Physocladia obscura]|uniref:Class E vacuolar protein-sorting machinery protein HSE1 n=1 Tax=Physocladia obscura TaxID=109957 RepID=A0AAD5T9C6_9FUNG|nr:ESCRT-0 subunit protein hse1 [Physocladia obscura]